MGRKQKYQAPRKIGAKPPCVYVSHHPQLTNTEMKKRRQVMGKHPKH